MVDKENSKYILYTTVTLTFHTITTHSYIPSLQCYTLYSALTCPNLLLKYSQPPAVTYEFLTSRRVSASLQILFPSPLSCQHVLGHHLWYSASVPSLFFWVLMYDLFSVSTMSYSPSLLIHILPILGTVAQSNLQCLSLCILVAVCNLDLMPYIVSPSWAMIFSVIGT